MDNVREKVADKTERQSRSTLSAVDSNVFPAILARELKRLQDALSASNSSTVDIRDSELQPLMFFKSCRRSFKESNWDFNTMTLRKFFHEVDLPFFDEELYISDNCTDRTPLTALMKLALQFGITPLFSLYFSEREISVSKSSHLDVGPYEEGKKSDYIAERWRNALLNESRDTANDSQLLVEFGAVLDAFHIRAPERDLLTWGRNYRAVMHCVEHWFRQYSDDQKSYRLSERSNYSDSTYFDLLDQHAGNILHLDEDHVITFAVHFFEPIIILTTDHSLSQILTDYIRFHLLRNELTAPIMRTECALKGNSCRKIQRRDTPLKYCARLVSSGHPRTSSKL